MFTNHNDMVFVSDYQWNGKIVTWFFVEQVPANERRRIERPGTLETKSVCVGRKETEDLIIDNLSSDPVPPISEAS